MSRRLIVGLIATVCVLFACGLGAWLVGGSVKPRIRRVNEANPRLQEAIRRAQRELPVFLRQLANPRPGQRFAIQARFDSPSGPEYLWVRDPVLVGSELRGILDQTPIAARDYRKGQEVRVRRADVVDWLIREPDGTRRGMYAERALRD